MKKYTCFVISPIGDEGSEIYREYKDLFDLIIVPALEIFDFEVKRGDHFISENKIDDSIIKNIQDADICICDISQPNPNVYYELGRRDETGKPILLLKKKGTAQSPVDIATRRYFEYEWEGRYSIRDAQSRIREFVRPLVEAGFESRSHSANLAEIADCINRLERKVDRLQSQIASPTSFTANTIRANDNSDPREKYKLAIMQKDIVLAEEALQQLKRLYDPITFVFNYVMAVADLGSIMAGDILINYAEEYIDNSNISLQNKVTYLSHLITYITSKALAKAKYDFVNNLCTTLELQSESSDSKDIVSLYIQQTRFYEGLFSETKNPEWLNECIYVIKKGLAASDYSNYILYHHLAYSYFTLFQVDRSNTNMLTKAKENIDKSLALNPSDEKYRLTLICRIYYSLNDPESSDYLERLAKIDPVSAQLIYNEFNQ